MEKNIIHIALPLVCMILTFFLGYAYAHRQGETEYKLIQENPQYIDISTNTRNITIKNTPKNIFFRIDGELLQTGSIDLK